MWCESTFYILINVTFQIEDKMLSLQESWFFLPVSVEDYWVITYKNILPNKVNYFEASQQYIIMSIALISQKEIWQKRYIANTRCSIKRDIVFTFLFQAYLLH